MTASLDDSPVILPRSSHYWGTAAPELARPMDGLTEINCRPAGTMHPRALSMLQAFEEIDAAPSHAMMCKYASVIHAPVELVKDWFSTRRSQPQPTGKPTQMCTGIQTHGGQPEPDHFLKVHSNIIDEAAFVPPYSSESWLKATRSPCPTYSSGSSSPKSSLTASLDSDDGAIHRELALDAILLESRPIPTPMPHAGSHTLEQDAIAALQQLSAGDFWGIQVRSSAPIMGC